MFDTASQFDSSLIFVDKAGALEEWNPIAS
jgi:hypothetical protein